MPKIRGIKPETWTDENFVELTPLARLLFIGLWNYACDNGHVEDKPKQIKMRILPADDCNASELLRELADHHRIVRENGWVTVPTLRDHQRIDKRWFVKCDKAGCEKPESKKGDSQPEPRGGHDEAPTRPPSEPDVASRGPRDDVEVDVDGDLMVSGVESSRELALREAPRADVERICEHLAQRIEQNGAKRPRITKAWRDSARLMLDRDERPEAEVHQAIEWATRDSFWMPNILSVPKLREKYDQLKLQAARKPKPTGRNEEQQGLLARAMARAEARERNGA